MAELCDPCLKSDVALLRSRKSTEDAPFQPCLCLCRLQLSVKGYSDKQHILLKKIIEKMATFEIDEKRFDIIKEAVSKAGFMLDSLEKSASVPAVPPALRSLILSKAAGH